MEMLEEYISYNEARIAGVELSFTLEFYENFSVIVSLPPQVNVRWSLDSFRGKIYKIMLYIFA